MISAASNSTPEQWLDTTTTPYASKRPGTSIGAVISLLALALYAAQPAWALEHRDATAAAATPTAPAATASGRSAAQRYIVKFRATPGSLDNSSGMATQRNNEHAQFARDTKLHALGVGATKRAYRHAFNGVALEAAPDSLNSLRALPFVEAVYPDVEVRAALDTSVPHIGASQAWTTYGVTGAGVRVAIIDTGVDYAHADLGGCLGAGCKVIGGYDFVNDDTNPADDHGHGTHVAGIVAADGALKGVAPDASLVAYKVLNAGGSGWSSDIIAAIDTAADPDGNPATDDGAHVINLSLGGWGDPDDAMSQAIDNVTQQGVVAVVAAGNSGPYEQSIGSPGTARRAITVGATDDNDAIARFSSAGPVVWPGGALLKPDIVAPGVSICSARWATAWPGNECVDAQHVALSGTSMATPHVAGVAALLRQQHPGWSPTQIKLALRNTALNLNVPTTIQGYGRVQPLQALALDHAPPLASIQTSGLLTTAANIIGTARSGTLQRYELSIGTGLTPSGWEIIATATSQVQNSTLAPNFDARLRPDGFHTLRLRVWDTSGLVSEDRTFIEVQNVVITSPQTYDSARRGAVVDITGTVLGMPGFQSYTIEYGSGHNPTQWYSTGITLTNGGTQPIDNNLLGTWNTAGLSAPGWYGLRVTAANSWGSSVETIASIYLDPRLKTGWPVRVPYDEALNGSGQPLRTDASIYTIARRESTTNRGAANAVSANHATLLTSAPEFQAQAVYYWAGMLVPVTGDVDGNGTQEIVILKGGVPATLSVYEADGSLKWSAPLGTSGVSGGNLALPTIADIDGDGAADIAVAVPAFPPNSWQSRLFVFRGDGTTLPGFPVSLPWDYKPTVIAADLNRDGARELVVYSNSSSPRYVTIIDRNGRAMSQWTLPVRRWVGSIDPVPAVGNFDNDDALELVIAEPSEHAGYDSNTGTWNSTGAVRVYNMDGTIVTGWPRYTSGYTLGSPAIADINGDGNEDIVVGHMYVSPNGTDLAMGGIEVFNRDGTVHAGWPRLQGMEFWATPAIGDLNGDGRPEIVVSDLSRNTWALNADGSTATGWPKMTAWANYHSVAISDVNGDSSPDVVATAANGIWGGGVYAWTRTAASIPGFPLYTEVDAQAGPTVADLDNDGVVEVVASSDWDMTATRDKLRGSVYVWDLGTTHAPNAAFWPHVHHDGSHSGRYKPLAAADLIESAVSVPPTARNRGYQFNIEDTVHNRGSAVATATVTRYYLSSDTVRDAADIPLSGTRAVPDLASQATSTGDVDVTVPGTVAIGQYSVLACADDTLLVAEGNENNNCLAAGVISITAPDLRQTPLNNPPTTAKRGASFVARDTTENAGNGLAPASTTRYYLSLDKVKGSGDIRLTGSRTVPQLARTTSSAGTAKVTVPATAALKTYYLLSCADDPKTVNFETSESNNCRASAGTIRIVP